MTYEYLCSDCGHAWEEEQSISALPTEICPSCSRKSAKRQVSGGVGFILKGGGWYADGYGSGSPKKSDETATKPSDSKSAESTSESTKASPKKSEGTGGSKSGDSGTGDSGKGGGATNNSAASPPA